MLRRGFAPILVVLGVLIVSAIALVILPSLSKVNLSDDSEMLSSPSSSSNQDLKTHNSSRYKLTLKYPSNWQSYTNATSKDVTIPSGIRSLPTPNEVLSDTQGCVFFIGSDIGSHGPTDILKNTDVKIDNVSFNKRSWYQENETMPLFSYYFPTQSSFTPLFEAIYTWSTNSSLGCDNALNQIISTIDFPDTVTTTSSPQPIAEGAKLNEIRYTLPLGWKAEINSTSLMFTAEGGGYLSLKVYDYDQTGRREFYCKTSQVCIDSSRFTVSPVGNVSGYLAESLDNSGGGNEYFAAKGNRFYIISTFSPPGTTTFSKTYQDLLDSLKF